MKNFDHINWNNFTAIWLILAPLAKIDTILSLCFLYFTEHCFKATLITIINRVFLKQKIAYFKWILFFATLNDELKYESNIFKIDRKMG